MSQAGSIFNHITTTSILRCVDSPITQPTFIHLHKRTFDTLAPRPWRIHPPKMAAKYSRDTPLLPFFLLLFHSTWSAPALSSRSILPPLPILPLPSASQLQWQLGEMALFLHFGPNTFTDSEWGTGHADPAVFAPAALNARQWARAAAVGGFSRVVLTAKHHDGFCLWPSAYTNYSVRSSPWRGGRGDVVAELASAAREFGIGFGLYLSPWDRHDPSYGKTAEYNEYYLGQMRELLTGSESSLFYGILMLNIVVNRISWMKTA